MTLTDAGPLVALLNRQDRHHARCKKALASLSVGPLITTWPCFTEAMYLLFQGGGYKAQYALWEMYQFQRLGFHQSEPNEIERMITVMEKYQDTPMDLADASLVVTAETLG